MAIPAIFHSLFKLTLLERCFAGLPRLLCYLHHTKDLWRFDGDLLEV